MGFIVNTNMGYLVDLNNSIFCNEASCAVIFPNNLDKAGRREIYDKVMGAGAKRYWYEDVKE